ncbi:MAG: hypothetical protein FJX67_12190 [Alphaproteobacteria bacterium]|nr:hypothetical protein [Alphaproteobacteria bacterium]
MDYVTPGQVIELGSGGSLTLGYFRPCRQETIVGGTVTVGADESRVVGGRMSGERVECDGGQLKLTTSAAGKGAVMAFRAPRPGGQSGGVDQPSVTIHALCPLFKVPANATEVTIARLDRQGPRIVVPVRNGFADLLGAAPSLAAGGVYRASAGAERIVFRVDPKASAPTGPMLSRLVPF